MQSGSFAEGDVAWFLEGELNVSVNCVDRHALTSPDKVSLTPYLLVCVVRKTLFFFFRLLLSTKEMNLEMYVTSLIVNCYKK